jgi:hypothetical protein
MTQEVTRMVSPDEWLSNYLEESAKDPVCPIRMGNLVIGAYYHINGDGAEEREAQVTRFEIELLCKHWAEEWRDANFMYAAYRQTGSYEMRVRWYARTRLDYFAEVLGIDIVQAIVDEAFKDFDTQAAETREAYEASLAEEADTPDEAESSGFTQ